MKKLTISAKTKDGDKELTGQVTIDVPETLDEAVKVYSPEAILTNAMANFVITIQSNIRGALKRKEAPEAMQTRLADTKMGIAASKAGSVDTKAAWLAEYAAATPDQKKKMKADLMAEAESMTA